MIAFASVCEGQDVKVVEKLADGSYIVSIDNVEFRAITGDKAVELAKMKPDLEAAQKVNGELNVQIKEALLQRDLATAQKALIQEKADSFEADSKRHEADATRNYNLFIGERTLRREASAFIPKGNAHGFWGKTLDFLNSQKGQVALKFVMPTAQFAKVFTARCP